MLKIVGAYSNVVTFYDVEGEFGWMANTHRDYPVMIDGIIWPTVEHYFQAMKFPGDSPTATAYRQAILTYAGRHSELPSYAKQLSTQQGLQRDWKAWDGTPPRLNGEKHEVMRKAISAKLDQYPQLNNILYQLPSTAIVVEASDNNIWGDGNDGSGTNHLGILYMAQLRHLRTGDDLIDAERQALKHYKAFNTYRRKTFPGKSLDDPQFDPRANMMPATTTNFDPDESPPPLPDSPTSSPSLRRRYVGASHGGQHASPLDSFRGLRDQSSRRTYHQKWRGHLGKLIGFLVGLGSGIGIGIIPATLIFTGIILLPSTFGASASMIAIGLTVLVVSMLIGSLAGLGIGAIYDKKHSKIGSAPIKSADSTAHLLHHMPTKQHQASRHTTSTPQSLTNKTSSMTHLQAVGKRHHTASKHSAAQHPEARRFSV